MKNTILYGNGFNRLINNGISWEDVLNKLKDKTKFSNGLLPYTMVYERALLENPKASKENFGEFEFSVKSELSELMKTMKPAPIYSDLLALNLDNYVTTNYDYCLNEKMKLSGLIDKSQSTEDIYSIRRKTIFESHDKKEKCKIWNIHGEINYPPTIMLGYDHYIGSMGKLDGYVKGTYEFYIDKNKVRPESIKDKLMGKIFDGHSWIELFFNSNIHILGLKLDYSETDIYWILNKRIRLYKELGEKLKLRNKIHFYTNEDNTEKADLLRSFGVDVHYKKYKHEEIYKYALDKIAKH